MSHYGEFDKGVIESKGGGKLGLWAIYNEIEALRQQASQTINPMLKAKLAEQAIGLSLELTKGLLLKVEKLEVNGHEH